MFGVRCLLIVVCWLFVFWCLLLVADVSFVACRSLVDICLLLFDVRCVLFVGWCCLLFAVRWFDCVFVVCCLLFLVRRLLLADRCLPGVCVLFDCGLPVVCVFFGVCYLLGV